MIIRVLVAIFFCLAVGVVLAKGPTQPTSVEEERDMLLAHFEDLTNRMDAKQDELTAAEHMTNDEKQAEMEDFVEECFNEENLRKEALNLQPEQHSETEEEPDNDTNSNGKRQPFPTAPLTLRAPYTAREINGATTNRKTSAFTTFTSTVSATQSTGRVSIHEAWSTNNNPGNSEAAFIDKWGLVGGGFRLTAASNTILITAAVTRPAPNTLDFHSFNDIDFLAFRSHTTTVDNYLKLHLVRIPGAVSVSRRFTRLEHNSFSGQRDFCCVPSRTAAPISPFVQCIPNVPAGQYEILIGIENAIATRTDDIRIIASHTDTYIINSIRVQVDPLNRQCNPFRGT